VAERWEMAARLRPPSAARILVAGHAERDPLIFI
jgi:hypothetical protein